MTARINRIIPLLIVAFVLVTAAPTFAGQIIYVDTDAPGSNNGSSWENAYNYLQDALAELSYNPDINEIRVAQGTYKPDEDTDHPNGTGGRSHTFQLRNGVAIKGGYAGFGLSDPNARNVKAYETILTGGCHVVTACEVDATAILYGFIITGGNAHNCSNYYGGGMYICRDSSPTIINCAFVKNSAHRAGALYIGENSSSMIINCTFIQNSAEWGGAIWNYFANPTLLNCIFTRNSTSFGHGGGIHNYTHGNLTVNNCTFTGNSAASWGGGIYTSWSTLTMNNCILWANRDNYGVNESAQIAWHRYRTSPGIINYCCIESWTGVLGGAGNIGDDPLFVDLNNGDYHLLPDSPCIDAGDPNYIADINETDLDGKPRVIGGRIDMGAYEFQGPRNFYVDDDAAGINDGSSWADAFNFLQDALAAAYSGDEIRVAQGIYKPDQGAGITPGDREATFQLINGVALKGGYAGFGEPDPNARDIQLYETILSGDLVGNDKKMNYPCDLLDDPTRAENSYHVVTSSRTDDIAVLDGFTITGGYANGEGWPVCLNRGGGIYSYSGSPTLMNCTISGNSASVGGGIENHGSGMYNHLNCNPTLTNCAISRNNGGGIRSSGSPTLINCTISGNNGFGMRNGLGSPTLTNCIISGNNGGGWYSCDSYSTLINCVFVGNSSDWDGGAWFSWDSDSVLVNCAFVGNSASRDGGGIYSTSDYSMILTNCILWGNSDSGGMDASAQIDVDGGERVNYCCIQGWTGGLGGTGNIDEDPCFMSPGYWGHKEDPNIVIEPNDPNALWIYGDYHLLWDSPCIDAGDPSYIAEHNETDLDGKPRVLDGDNDGVLVVDMGAYEYRFTISAEARIVPKTINLTSRGNWITAYIWLPEGYDVADIDPNSVFLEEQIKAEELLVDEHKQVATATFDREKVQSILNVGDIELTITCQLTDGTYFEATDIIKVTDKASQKAGK